MNYLDLLNDCRTIIKCIVLDITNTRVQSISMLQRAIRGIEVQKVLLTKITQNEKTFYVGKADPRILVHLTDDIKVGDVQDAQRPLKGKHLQKVAKYVGEEKGILPSNIMISTKQANRYKKKIEVKSESVKVTTEDGQVFQTTQYYTCIPNKPDEYEEYAGTINVIDGQHRLFSFKEEFISPYLKNDDVFEIAFALFETPTMKTRRELFTLMKKSYPHRRKRRTGKDKGPKAE